MLFKDGIAKNSRYLKYAFGEIILVVLGILIALQINNWNLDRIERKTEQNILRSLRFEFAENLKDAQRVYDGYMGILNAMSEIQQLEVNSKIRTQSFDSLVYFLFDWFDFTPRPGASNNLVNSGSLGVIQNEELRGMLTVWPGIDEELNDDEQLAINYSQNVIIPFLASVFPISNLEKFDYTLEFYREQDVEFQSFDKEMKYERTALIQNPTFQSHISTKKMYARHCAVEAIRVVEACQRTLQLIDLQIEPK